MEENKDKKPYVKIGVIGHVGYGKTKLNEEIEKILKEGNNKKSKKEKFKEKVQSTAKHEIFVDVSDIDNLEI